MNIELLNKILSLSLLVDEPAHCCGSRLGKVNEVGLLGWSKHVGYTVLDYQPGNIGVFSHIFII